VVELERLLAIRVALGQELVEGGEVLAVEVRPVLLARQAGVTVRRDDQIALGHRSPSGPTCRTLPIWPLISRTDIETAKEAILQSPHGGSRMQLAQQLDDDTPIDMGTAMWKLYVNTDDVQALYAKAIAAGCESVIEPQKLDRWPVTIAFVKDFDGYLVEFVEYEEAPPAGVPNPKDFS
jgi:lactoylglutathione lyase